ncbi:related to beta-alanine synthase [Cephalotrichum gorgonifer]|uniref:Related to beta-alanine synthase n=1 Tax=Cephalotrichum gorgonifer TaxID=2041049 RepID=A0AAE8SYA2_9PEZI|nr:related to beta-alanine synthase [Cephalotrichum gorgonifer]
MEVLRTLHENGHQIGYDVGAVNWPNEEGARFPKSMLSSGVWVGDIPVEKAWGLADIFDSSVTVKSELERLGFLGKVPCSHADDGYPLGAHFELHIEQGPVLQENRKRIGVVQGAQAYRWFTFTVTGQDAHTGTTPLQMRRDPVLEAARMIAAPSDTAKNFNGLASTGVLKIPPGSSTNTIASGVSFSLDIRHPDDEVVTRMQDEILASFERISGEDGRGVELSWTLDTDSPIVKFHPDCIGGVARAADRLAGPDGLMPITS